ncbi:sugar ABC transporter permease [Rathayibacter sp. Leaf299]|uniref:carbohydrate ABC transporter permease n=1 Tax=Rathayibacter sp. Leaf299 TaxID=1736328 RepID=UPI0006F9554A|nr:sugar ABC transporter permease [Rathayibacter sp. Leaf299]
MTAPTSSPLASPLSPRRSATSRWWLYPILTVAVLLTVLPFAWMLLYSFLPEEVIRGGLDGLLPLTLTGENFARLLDLGFPRYFLNSALVAVVVTLGNIVFASMVGYALAKLTFRGRDLVFGLVLGMLMIPTIVTFIPLFVLTSRLGLVNSYPGLILPYLVTPIGIFLMRQFIDGIPDELLQAARIDGAGEMRIFFGVVLPLSTPALATLSILTFLSSWNNFLWPLVVAQSDDYYTLPVALALYSTGTQGTNYGLLMAGAVAVIVPILILFVVLQRHFTQGVATTGLK